MTTSSIGVTEGSGKNMASHSISEDAKTKELQRVVLETSAGVEIPFPASLGQKAKAASLAVTLASDEDSLGLLGAITETAPASDTASSGLNGRLQRIAQRITSLIALLPTALGANGGLKIEGVASGTVVPVSGTVTAELSATDNAVLDNIDADLTTIIGHVDGIEALLGTIDADTGNIATAVQIMDDWDNAASDGASVSGDVAHDSVDAGEPVKIGGKALSAEASPVAANDRVNAAFDLVGKQIVMPYTNPENIVSGAITTPMTGTTSTSLIAAPAAGLRNYITTIIVSNAHATVGTDVIIQDGSGGTTLLTIPAAAVYGGAVINLPVPLRQPTANTALFCANVTTGASTKVSAVGYKGA